MSKLLHKVPPLKLLSEAIKSFQSIGSSLLKWQTLLTSKPKSKINVLLDDIEQEGCNIIQQCGGIQIVVHPRSVPRGSMNDLRYLSALYRLGLLSTSDYRQALTDLYVQTRDPKVMVAVRRRFVRSAVVS